MILTWAILPCALGSRVEDGIPEAWLILAMGIAIFVTPSLERHPARTAPIDPVNAPSARLRGRHPGNPDLRGRSDSRDGGRTIAPRPLPGTPNVLLIVLDTVRADHSEPLRLRATNDSQPGATGRSAASGSIRPVPRPPGPSRRATLFIGRRPHELGVKWMCPLEADAPTIAEYLGSLGYATAGFVGNTYYCAYDRVGSRLHGIPRLRPGQVLRTPYGPFDRPLAEDPRPDGTAWRGSCP